MAAQDAVEYSNQCLETINRLPHPQEVWDAALASMEEKKLQSAPPTNSDYEAALRVWRNEWLKEVGKGCHIGNFAWFCEQRLHSAEKAPNVS